MHGNAGDHRCSARQHLDRTRIIKHVHNLVEALLLAQLEHPRVNYFICLLRSHSVSVNLIIHAANLTGIATVPHKDRVCRGTKDTNIKP